jgi:hypothetical protein
MSMFLAHGNVEWIVAGFVVFFGIMVFLSKLFRGKLLDLTFAAAIWYLVFNLHSGSNAGIMTATLAALLFDLFGMPILRLLRKASRH